MSKPQIRECFQLRELREDGYFSGYLTVWGEVDSYNSVFTKGSFKKTIQERGDKVKVLYNHDVLIGRALNIVEDDYGVFAEGQLNLQVQQSVDVLSFMRDGTLEGLSFMFKAIKQKVEKGVLTIREVKLFEFGPVDFPSGEKSIITEVREMSEDTNRGTTFAESLTEEELYAKDGVLKYALFNTLSDIWWTEGTQKERVVMFKSAIDDFKAGYVAYAKEWMDMVEVRDDPAASQEPGITPLAESLRKYAKDKNVEIRDLALTTSLTVEQITLLLSGRGIEDGDKLKELGEDVVLAHKKVRNAQMETLCNILRGTLSETEKKRCLNLLQPATVQLEPAINADQMIDFFRAG